MKWITHIALAFFLVKVVEIALMVDLLDSYWAYAIVSLFAVLPDFDYLVGIKHRTWTHTLWFTLIALILLPFSWKLALIGWISILSHLFGDMMTHSGVKLLYPYKMTVFYLVPPRWRFRVGSSAEFMVLGLLIVGSILIGSISAQSDVEKLFELSKDHVVAVSLSTFENGAVHNYENIEIVWTDGKSELGFIQNGKLKIIEKDQILSTNILKAERTDKTANSIFVRVKDLRKAIWRHRIITGYEDDGVAFKFSGTGLDLYLKLNGKKLEKEGKGDYIIKVWYYEAR